jgi:hypothetical protein
MNAAVRFAAAAALPMLMEELGREGAELVTFDGRGVKHGGDLLAALGRALAFPSYYGRNWDAAEECLRDLAERYPRGVVLFIEGADTLWQCLPREMGMLTSLWLAASKTAAVPLRLIFLLEEQP